MCVYCVCCVLSGRGLCDELITHPKESYRLWRVVLCDHETSWTRRPYPALGCEAGENKIIILPIHYTGRRYHTVSLTDTISPPYFLWLLLIIRSTEDKISPIPISTSRCINLGDTWRQAASFMFRPTF
jgi:hypothetical protein